MYDIRELIALGALDDVVENKYGAVVGRFENEDVLVLALLVVKNFLNLEGHGLAGPHAGDLAEPAIYCDCELLTVYSMSGATIGELIILQDHLPYL
jgi:hypothetical protein